MSFHNSSRDAVPDATASYVSDATTSIVSNLTDNSNSRTSRASHFTNQSDSSSLRRDREREGRCADCGAQTHEVQYDRETGSTRKVPLNIDGEVHRGRCLLCNPLPVRQQLHQRHQRQHYFEEDMVDDMDSVPFGSGASITQQYHHSRDRRSHYSSSGASTSQSLDGERRNHRYRRQRRGGRSDGSVNSSQSFNSAPMFAQSSSSQNIYPLAAQSAPHINRSAPTPPIDEFSMIPPRDGRQTRRQQQQQYHQEQEQEQEQHYSDTASRDSSVANHINNLALNEQQHPGQVRSLHEFSSSADQAARQEQPQQPQQPSNDAASIYEILSSMQRYPNHIPTQSKGLHSLWVLSWDSVNSTIIGRFGGIPLLLDSMRRNSNTMTLISNGISTLQNLAMDGANRDAIVESDGVKVITEVMAQFIEDKSIQQSGCTALANLANGCPEQKSHVAEGGGILAMMRAVEAHRGDESILRAAYQALRKLGFNPE